MPSIYYQYYYIFLSLFSFTSLYFNSLLIFLFFFSFFPFLFSFLIHPGIISFIYFIITSYFNCYYLFDFIKVCKKTDKVLITAVNNTASNPPLLLHSPPALSPVFHNDSFLPQYSQNCSKYPNKQTNIKQNIF